MDFPARLDALQQQVADVRSSVAAASRESRDQLRRRIDQSEVGGKWASSNTQQPAPAAKNKWEQMRANAASKMNEIKARADKRNREMDSDMAATDAEFAEADADDAIDQAAWAVDNARLAVLDAIDARANANVQAGQAAS